MSNDVFLLHNIELLPVPSDCLPFGLLGMLVCAVNFVVRASWTSGHHKPGIDKEGDYVDRVSQVSSYVYTLPRTHKPRDQRSWVMALMGMIPQLWRVPETADDRRRRSLPQSVKALR